MTGVPPSQVQARRQRLLDLLPEHIKAAILALVRSTPDKEQSA